ncbi:hypothetical protein ILYODFUR_009314 [Ilyodon furcidens]|uniref:Uncharacterized protein n=1 Tax=Ilyodon furcidens TaxID=33524 RepID=A0ABV0SMS3_9TELE
MNQCTINKQMSNNKHASRLTIKTAHVRKKKETRIHDFFPCDSGSSPLRNSSSSNSSSSSIWALSGHIIDWHSQEKEPVRSSSSPGGPGIKKGNIFSDFK